MTWCHCFCEAVAHGKHSICVRHYTELVLLSVYFVFSPIRTGFVRRHAMHQTVITACSTTAGHKAMPTGRNRIPAMPRMITAPRLYSSIALANPLAAALVACASQQVTPTAKPPPRPCAPVSLRGR